MINKADVNDEGKIDFKQFVTAETKEERINEKADIWAAACILFYLLTGKHAFKSQEKILKGFKGKIDKSYPVVFNYILENMLKLDPKERWSYNDLAELKVISDHFSLYKKLSHKDQIAEKIKWLFDECTSLHGAIESRKLGVRK